MAAQVGYRTVTVRASDLGTSEGVGQQGQAPQGDSYINPSLLLTQQSQPPPPPPPARAAASSGTSQQRAFGIAHGAADKGKDADRPDLFESISRLKQAPQAKPALISSSSSSSSSSVSSSSSSSVVAAAAAVAAEASSSQPASQASSSSSSSSSAAPAEAARRIPPAAAAFSWNARSIAAKPEPVPAPTPVTTKPAARSAAPASPPADANADPFSNAPPQLLEDVRKQLGPVGYRRFEEIFARRGRRDARELVTELLEIFAAAIADDGAVEMALLRLAPLVPPSMVAAYNTQVVRFCQANAPPAAEGAVPGKRKSGSPVRGESGPSKAYAHLSAAMASGAPPLSQSFSQSQGPSQGPGLNQASQPSKRAKLMLEAARGAPAKKEKDGRSVLAALANGQAVKPPSFGAAKATPAAAAAAAAVATKVYSCLVCMEVVKVSGMGKPH